MSSKTTRSTTTVTRRADTSEKKTPQAKPWELNPNARDMLTGVLEETGHVLTLDDFSDLYQTNELAKQVRNDHVANDLGLLQLPVFAGDYEFHPVSIGVWDWYSELPSEWYDDDETMQGLSMAFCLTFGPKRHDELLALSEQRRFEKALSKWRRHMTLPAEHLSDAMRACLPPPVTDPQDDPVKHGSVVALLKREYGNTADYWMWEVSIAFCRAMMEDYLARAFGEADANAKMTNRNGKKSTHVEKTTSKKIAAINAMRKQREILVEKWANQSKSA